MSAMKDLYLDARKLARAFHAMMAEALSLTERQEVDRLNAGHAFINELRCASQDLIDANMVMLGAFELCNVEGFDPTNAYHAEVWNHAWDFAQANGFSREWGA